MIDSKKLFIPSAFELCGSQTYVPGSLTEEQAGADEPCEKWWTRRPLSDPLSPYYAVPRYIGGIINGKNL